jgi:drug/metabolite transporter (DMT)-like permease
MPAAQHRAGRADAAHLTFSTVPVDFVSLAGGYARGVQRLRKGEWICGVSALVLLGVLFARWFGHATGWSSLGWAALVGCVLAILTGVALATLTATHQSPTLPMFLTILATLVGGLATIGLAVELASSSHAQAGAWIGLAAAVGVAVGGYAAMADDSTPHAPERPVEARPLPPVA